MKKDWRKYIGPVLIGVTTAGCTAGMIYLAIKTHKVKLDITKYFTEYKPFTDMSKEKAIELLKAAVDGTVEILDAQGPMDTDEIIIFLKP